MKLKIEKKLCFWLPTYPEILESFLVELILRDKYKVNIFCLGAFLPERENNYNRSLLTSLCNVSQWDNSMTLEDYFVTNMRGNEEAIHIFGGFLGTAGQCLNIYQNIYLGKQAFVFTEKPSILPYPSRLKTLVLKPLKCIKSSFVYRNAYRKNRKAIAGILVTGEKGVSQLNGYGIPREKLYNFMYTHIEGKLGNNHQTDGKCIKFVYVGRFNYCNRGLDDLIYAFEHLDAKNWSLDLVGGYGENTNEIIQWANNKDNVNYIGGWKSDQVLCNLQQYDICVSPTRVDGWRIQINQAIVAGIGTITTHEAISDELIKYSGAGAVIRASRKKELLSVLKEVTNNPQLVVKWKENAVNYSERISNKKVVSYFIEIIENSLKTNKETRPICPWIISH